MVDLKGKTVLVTGGTGFVGGRLVERLSIECGARVRVLVHNWAKATWVARLPVELVPGDLAEPDAAAAAVAGCSLVFHCASGGHDRESYRATNVAGTRHLLEAARLAGVERVVHVSSVVVHGIEQDGEILETSPIRPSDHPYTQSKIEAEEVVWDYGRRFGLPVTVVRPTFVWGPRGSQFTVDPVLAIRAGTFSLVDVGRAECPVVYVDNLVDALLLAATHPAAVGEAFLVTDGEKRAWKEYFEAYARMLGVSRLRPMSSTSAWVRWAAALADAADRGVLRLVGNPAPFWRRACRRSLRELHLWLRRRGIMSRRQMALYARRGGVSSRKAHDILGYKPRYALAEAMQETERWLRDQVPSVFRNTPDV